MTYAKDDSCPRMHPLCRWKGAQDVRVVPAPTSITTTGEANRGGTVKRAFRPTQLSTVSSVARPVGAEAATRVDQTEKTRLRFALQFIKLATEIVIGE